MAIQLGGGKSKSKTSQETSQSFNQTSQTSMGAMGQNLINNRMSELGNATYEGLTPDQINTYLNPYLDEVIGATTADIEAARDKAAAQYKQQQLAAGPLGSSARQPIHEAELTGQYDRTLATTLGGLRAQGHNQAANIASTENANKNNFNQSIQQQINQLLSLLAGSDTVTKTSGSSTGTMKGTTKGSNFEFGFKKG